MGFPGEGTVPALRAGVWDLATRLQEPSGVNPFKAREYSLIQKIDLRS